MKDYRLFIAFSSFVICFLIIVFCLITGAFAEEGTASYYTWESTRKEGNLGIMANGKKMDNKALTCAMWGLPFGTKVKVTNLENGKEVICEITDRGPAKRLVKKGRIIDLSAGAFEKIGELKTGVIRVKIEVCE